MNVPPRLSLTLFACLAMTVLLVATARAHAAVGDLDPGFSDDGIAEVDFGSHASYDQPPFGASARPVGVQPNGDLIIGGYSQYVDFYSPDLGSTASAELNLAALRPDGTLDPAFGEAGRLESDLGVGGGTAEAIVQPDGRILAGGFSSQYRSVYVARLTTTGQLDSTFSEDGLVFIGPFDFGSATIALQPDGRVVVATTVGGPPGRGQPDILALYRLNPDGSTDTSFINGGNDQLPAGDMYGAIGGIAVDGAGRIVVSTVVRASGQPPDQQLAVTRFLADGVLDGTYGNGGTFQTPLDYTSSVRPNVDSAGRVYVWLPPQGSGVIPNGKGSGLLRLTASGAPDPSFGDQGTQDLLPYAAGNGISLLPSGAIAVPIVDSGGVRVTRLLSDGSTDPTFTSQVWHTPPRCLSTIEPTTLGLDDGSTVIAGGHIHGAPGTPDRILVARYLADGQAASAVDPDPTADSCPPCEDSILTDCQPYETSISIQAHRHRISGNLHTSSEACANAEFAAIDRRRGRAVRVASVQVTDWSFFRGVGDATYEMKLPRSTSGRVFVRLRAIGDAAVCRAAVSSAVVIRARHGDH